MIIPSVPTEYYTTNLHHLTVATGPDGDPWRGYYCTVHGLTVNGTWRMVRNSTQSISPAREDHIAVRLSHTAYTHWGGG